MEQQENQTQNGPGSVRRVPQAGLISTSGSTEQIQRNGGITKVDWGVFKCLQQVGRHRKGESLTEEERGGQ